MSEKVVTSDEETGGLEKYFQLLFRMRNPEANEHTRPKSSPQGLM